MKNVRHPRGWFWHNDKLKYSFLAIPKSASNSIRDITGCLKGPDMIIHPTYKRFTVLREPIKRYISGFLEVMVPSSDYPRGRYLLDSTGINVNKAHLGLDNKMKSYLRSLNNGSIINVFTAFTDYIIKNGFFEAHTEPQHYYLINDITLYKLENLDFLLNDFKVKPSHLNKTESPHIKNEIINFLSTNEEYNNKIKNYS